MASTTEVLGIEVVATTGAAQQSFDQLSKAVKKASDATKEADKATRELEKAQKKAAAEAKKKAAELVKLRDHAGGLAETLGKLNGLMTGGIFGALAIGAVRSINQMVESSTKWNAIMGQLPFGLEAANKSTRHMADQMVLGAAATKLHRAEVITTSKAFADFAAVAVKLGSSIGKDANSSIQEFSQILATGSKDAARSMGIVIDQTIAFEDYAFSIHKSVEALTDMEKKQAIANEIMLQAKLATKGAALAAGEGAAAWNALANDVEGAWQDTMNFLGAAYVGAKNLTDQYHSLIDAAVAWETRNIGTNSREPAVRAAIEATEAAGPNYASDAEVARIDREMAEAEQRSRAVDDYNYARGELGLDSEYMGDPNYRRKGRGKRKKPPGPLSRDAAPETNANYKQEIEEAIAAAEQIAAATAQAKMDADNQVLEFRRQQVELTEYMDPELRLEKELSFIQQEQQIQTQHIDFLTKNTASKAALIELEAKREQVAHEAKLKRMAVTAKAQQDAIRKEIEMRNASVQATRMGVSVLGELAATAAQSERGRRIATAVETATLETIAIASDAASAATAIAAQNYMQGTMYMISAAAHGVALGKAVAAGGGGGGSSHQDPGFTGPGMGGGGGGPQRVRPTGGGGGGGGIPTSYAPHDGTPGPGGGSRRGQHGGVSIGVVNVMGSVDEDSARKIAHAIDDARLSGGVR